ncbi:carbohydrate ABC transporter permease [Micromonospora sp. BQ11]|uniref:carbohydrate ABC transporter permease n=1 Tax=Micromonospora sp. BQ11 TaxID=3452212 RepID=UPI003F8B3446
MSATTAPTAHWSAEQSTSRRGRPAGNSLAQPSNLLTVAMLAALVYFLLPLFWLVVAATKSNSGLFSSFGLWFDGTDVNLLTNIRETLTYQDGIFVRWLANTAFYAVVSSGGAALLATACGYAFAKYDFPGKNGMFTAVLGSIMVPSTALAIPTYLLLSRVGLVDTPLAIILPSLLSPFGVYLMRVYAAGAVPDGLIEAARIDGAGEFRIFWQVAFRQLVPGFVTVLLFTLVATWNNYFLPLIMLNDPQWFPVTVGLAQWNAQASGGGGAQALFSIVITGSLLAIVPLVAAFLLLQRYWQSGLGVGGVKE